MYELLGRIRHTITTRMIIMPEIFSHVEPEVVARLTQPLIQVKNRVLVFIGK